MKAWLPLFGWVMMFLTGLTIVAAEKSASGSFVTVRAEAQELARIGEEDFRGTSTNNRPISYKIKAKKGWKLQSPKNGKLDLAMGELDSYAVTSLMGEDGGTGTVHTCDNVTTVVTNHFKPILSATAAGVADCILVPPKVTSAQLAITGNVTVISNGQHVVITTVVPCSTCGEPKASVTTNTVAITPSSYCWAWSVAGTNGSVIGSTLAASACVTNPAFHSLSVTATATNLPACCVCSAQTSTNALVMQLDSATEVVLGNNPRRRTLGVGEDVRVFLLPSSVLGTWKYLRPNGTQDSVFGNWIEFEAPYKDLPRTVTFEHTNGLRTSLPFAIKEPSGYVAKIKETKPYPLNSAGVGATFDIWIMPTNVSLRYVHYKEPPEMSTDPKGYFADPTLFSPYRLDHANAGAGVEGTLSDNNATGDYVNTDILASPWVNGGSFSWKIPAFWWVEKPNNIDLSTNALPWSSQVHSLTNNGTTAITKFEITVIRTTNNVYTVTP